VAAAIRFPVSVSGWGVSLLFTTTTSSFPFTFLMSVSVSMPYYGQLSLFCTLCPMSQVSINTLFPITKLSFFNPTADYQEKVTKRDDSGEKRSWGDRANVPNLAETDQLPNQLQENFNRSMTVHCSQNVNAVLVAVMWELFSHMFDDITVAGLISPCDFDATLGFIGI
jgi:hypothetical protein